MCVVFPFLTINAYGLGKNKLPGLRVEHDVNSSFFFGNKYKTVKYHMNRLAADVQFVQYISFFFWYSVKKYSKKIMHSFVTINIFFNI